MGAIVWGTVIRGAIILGDNCPGGAVVRGAIIRGAIVRRAIVLEPTSYIPVSYSFDKLTENWRKQLDNHKIKGAVLINIFISDLFLFTKNPEPLIFCRWKYKMVNFKIIGVQKNKFEYM